jgi:hypothetical protein
MKAAMLRIGIDSGSGGIHGPLFRDGSFDYIPIPDGFGIDERTYGNTTGLKQRKLVEYFPEPRRVAMANRSIHFDPEHVGADRRRGPVLQGDAARAGDDGQTATLARESGSSAAFHTPCQTHSRRLPQESRPPLRSM